MSDSKVLTIDEILQKINSEEFSVNSREGFQCDGCDKELNFAADKWWHLEHAHNSIDFCTECVKTKMPTTEFCHMDIKTVCFYCRRESSSVFFGSEQHDLFICSDCCAKKITIESLFILVSNQTHLMLDGGSIPAFLNKEPIILIDSNNSNNSNNLTKIIINEMDKITISDVDYLLKCYKYMNLLDPKFGSYRAWIPLTKEYVIPDHNGTSCLLVNCNTGQIASLINNQDILINIIYDSIDEYSHDKLCWKKTAPKPLRIEHSTKDYDEYMASICTEFSGHIIFKKSISTIYE